MICFPLDNTEYGAEALGAYLCTRTRGVFSAETNLAVTAASGMSVTVSPGLAWLKYAEYWGTCALQPQPLTLDITIADGALSRIDAVVCRLDKIQNRAEIIIKKGAYAASPTVAAPVRNSNYDEIYLATISVTAGTVSLSAALITDQRMNETYCGLMRDGVSGIPTLMLQAQAQELINQLREVIAGVETGTEMMLKAIYDPHGKNTDIFAYAHNRNIARNTDFTNPVNQRNFTTGTFSASRQYTVDGWCAAQIAPQQVGTLSLTTAGLVGSHVHVMQYYEKLSDSKDYTLSVGLVSGVKRMTFKFPQSKTLDGLNAYKDGDYFVIDIYLDSDTLVWVLLEEGTIASRYVPKGYAAELQECLPYFFHAENQIICGNPSTSVCPGRDFPLPMRTDKPTVTIYGNGTASGYLGAWGNATYATVTAIAVKKTGIAYVQANKNAAADGVWTYSFDASADL